MERQDELRKLPAASLYKVALILETNYDWQKIMSLIPKNPRSEHFEHKYNYEHMRLIEEHAKKTNRKCAEILFDEWGTSGRVRPTLDTLMNLLVKADMYRAADEVAHMLGEPIPHRPGDGPAAEITIGITSELNSDSIKLNLNSMDSIKTSNLNNSSQDHLCNGTTRQLKNTTDMIEFSKSNMIPDTVSKYRFQSIGQQPTAQMLTAGKDLIEFSKSMNSKDFPDFSALMPKSESFVTREKSPAIEISPPPSDLSQCAPPYQTSVPNLSIFNIVDNAILEDKNLIHFDYKELETITNRFMETFSEHPNGPVGKIGSGGFGEVFVGTHSKYGHLAVKRVRSFFYMHSEPETMIKVFNTEVKSLSQLRHENIVPIFGYSLNGPTPCIVCKYIDGGSLQQKIAAEVLSEYQRIIIIKGTAEGLKYIHNSERPQESESQSGLQLSRKSYYLHGDVKSANILLTKDCTPKLCDFGLAKQLDTTFITKSMMGTQAYMAPEGFSGTVTQKNDIFSFGIVLLELLTGLKPIISVGADNQNIKNYVEENCLNGDITTLLDKVVDEWKTADKVYSLAKQCLMLDKNERPTIDIICNILNGITVDEIF